jgi:transmembrane sensor
MSDRERLVAPLSPLLENRLPEQRVQRLWRAIERGRVKSGPSPVLVRAIAIAAAAFVALSVWALRPPPAAALRLANGKDVPASFSAVAPVRVSFDDGSHVDLRARAHLDVLESTARVFGLALRDGASEFEVHPGGPRAWRIECDGVTVEVVGTHFVLERSPETLRVRVTRGAVTVRGTHVPDSVVRLGAGQSIAVALTDASTPGGTRSNAAPKPGAMVPAPVEPASVLPGERPDAVHVGNAARGELGRSPSAGGALGPSLVASEPMAPSSTAPIVAAPSASTLEASMTDADAARREGRFRDAAALLERGLSQSPGDSRAPLAEFSLGRLYLETLSDAGRAATHFSRALSGHLPAGLAEDARARLVEAYARGGNVALATDEAARYRALYPAGRRLADVDRWAPSVRPY